MSEKIHIDANVVRLLFYKYRSILLPILAIIISWGIFLEYGIPQIENFLSSQSQVQASEQTLAVMTQNYNTITQMNDASLTHLLNVANQALPTTKDYTAILNDISLAVGKTGVSLSDYSFNVGDISDTVVSKTGSSISLSLSIVGTVDQIKNFISILSQQFPLSDIASVSLGGGGTTIPVKFFYSPAQSPTVVNTSPLPVLSASQKTFLSDLEKNAGGTVISPTPELSQTPVSSSAAR